MSAANKAALAGHSAHETPNYRLAAAIRKVNRLFERLEPAQQQAVQEDWHEDFRELQHQLDRAGGDASRHDLIAKWRDDWAKRLDFTYRALDSFSYREQPTKEQWNK